MTGLATIKNDPVKQIVVGTGGGKLQLWEAKEKQAKPTKEQSLATAGKTVRIIALAVTSTHVVCAIDERPTGGPKIAVIEIAKIGTAGTTATFPTIHQDLVARGVRYTCIAVDEKKQRYAAGTLGGVLEEGRFVAPFRAELWDNHQVRESEALVHQWAVNCVAASAGKILSGGGATESAARLKMGSFDDSGKAEVPMAMTDVAADSEQPPATAIAIGASGKVAVAVGNDWSRGRNAPSSWQVGVFVYSQFK